MDIASCARTNIDPQSNFLRQPRINFPKLRAQLWNSGNFHLGKITRYTVHLCTGWYVIIYTSDALCSPEERYTSTNNRSISSDCYKETKLSAKITFILFIAQYLLLQLTTNPFGSIEKQTFRSVQSLLSSVKKAEIWIHRSRDLTWLLMVSSKCCRITWQRDMVSTKHSCMFLLCNIVYTELVWRHSIYYMNHGYYSILDKYTPLVLGHQKYATDLGLGSYKCQIHLVAVVYILHIPYT